MSKTATTLACVTVVFLLSGEAGAFSINPLLRRNVATSLHALQDVELHEDSFSPSRRGFVGSLLAGSTSAGIFRLTTSSANAATTNQLDTNKSQQSGNVVATTPAATPSKPESTSAKPAGVTKPSSMKTPSQNAASTKPAASTEKSSPVGKIALANPGNVKNCSDFKDYAEAKAWYDKYFPLYGDVGKLDGDNDGVPCESLKGAPRKKK